MYFSIAIYSCFIILEFYTVFTGMFCLIATRRSIGKILRAWPRSSRTTSITLYAIGLFRSCRSLEVSGGHVAHFDLVFPYSAEGMLESV